MAKKRVIRKKTEPRPLRVGGCFEGIGGFPLAAEVLGLEHMWWCEWEPPEKEGKPEPRQRNQELLARWFPNATGFGDIAEVAVADLPDIDVLTGGTPCFPAGHLVLTKRGFVPIEEVEIGDEVVTHRGRWRQVTAVGNKMAPIGQVKGLGHWGLSCTPEHRFWTSDRRERSTRKNGESVRWWEYEEPDWVEAQELEGKYWSALARVPMSAPVVPSLVGNDQPPFEEFDEDIAWLVGRWIADGSSRIQSGHAGRPRRGNVKWSVSYEDRDVEKRLANLGIVHRVEAARTARNIHVSSKPLATWLWQEFGRGAANKTLPPWVFTLTTELRTALLEGYLAGDGSDKEGFWVANTVSRSLAVGMAMLARTLDGVASINYVATPDTTVIEGRTVNQRDYYSVSYRFGRRMSGWFEDHLMFGKVRTYTDLGEETTVYNLTVEEDHSYTVDGIVVKNCQGFSVAGKRAGLGDHRSGLFDHFIRLIDGLQERGLKWVVWENVPGALTSNKGEDFANVIAALVGADEPIRLPKHPNGRASRYSGVVDGPRGQLAWRVLDAQHFGVAQRRRRVIAVLHLGGRGAAEVLLEPQGRDGDPPARDPQEPFVARLVGPSPARSGGGDEEEASSGPQEELVALVSGVNRTITTRLSGHYDSVQEAPSALVPLQVQTNTGDKGACLTSSNQRLDYDTETLLGMEFESGIDAYNGLLTGELAHTIQGANGRPSPHTIPTIAGIYNIYPVSASKEPNTLVAHPVDVAAALAETSVNRRSDRGDMIVNGYGVRRLTPTECERLQGFPSGTSLDDSTGWTGGQPDSTRYRQLGNAIAVPVAGWILARIASHEAGVEWQNLPGVRDVLLRMPWILQHLAPPMIADPETRVELGGALAFDWQASGAKDTSWDGKARSWLVKMGDYAGALSATKVQAVMTSAWNIHSDTTMARSGDAEGAFEVDVSRSLSTQPGGSGYQGPTLILVEGATDVASTITASAGHHGHSSPRGDGTDNLAVHHHGEEESRPTPKRPRTRRVVRRRARD